MDKLRSDFVMYLIGVTIVLAVSWAAWEKHVENDRRYLSPAEQVHQREQAFHADLGALRAEVVIYKQEVDKLEEKIAESRKETAAGNGRVDVMREYFQKYSPEAFEKIVKKLQKNVDEIVDEMGDFERFDTRYAKIQTVNSLVQNTNHLPNKWQWEQHKKKLTEELDKIEKLEKAIGFFKILQKSDKKDIPDTIKLPDEK